MKKDCKSQRIKDIARKLPELTNLCSQGITETELKPGSLMLLTDALCKYVVVVQLIPLGDSS